MAGKNKNVAFLLLFLALLISCNSLPKKVNQALIDSDYLLARELLEDAEAGYNTTDKLSDKEIEARKLFEDKVNKDFINKMNSSIAQGELPQAISVIEEALKICPWSEELENQLLMLNNRVREIKRLERQWEIVNKDEFNNIAISREYLSNIEHTGQDFRMSDILVEIYNLSINCIDNYWNIILNDVKKVDDSNNDLLQIVTDFRFNPFSDVSSTGFFRMYNSILSKSYSSIGEILLDISKSYSEDSKGFPIYAKGTGSYEKIRELVLDWFNRNVELVFEEEPNYRNVDYVEQIAKNLNTGEDNKFETFEKLRYRYILNAADRLSGQSTAAILSLIYLQHASELDLYKEKDSRSIYKKSLASLVSSHDFSSDLFINAPGSIPLWQYEIVRLSLFSDIQNRSSSSFTWNLQTMDSLSNNKEIKIVNVKYYNPSIDDLVEITSSYLSHYENVPNPYKATLEYDLVLKKNQVNFAKSNYNNAVSNYNYNPTQWTLNAVNQASNNYQYAVNNYNQTINIYNATPDTISRPVYLPYSFYEGTVKMGWELLVEVIDGDQRYTLHGDAVNSDFVRIGTKRSDKKAKYRVDDNLSIRTDSEESISLLVDATSKITEKLWDFINSNVNLQFDANLEDNEIEIIKTLIHPWGDANKISNWPYWLQHSLATIKLPDFSPKPANIKITNCRSYHPRLNSVENLAKDVLSSIVLITSKEKGGGSSTSSGALISNDGLILTCAHGITGNNIEITINQKKYPCKINFVDSSNDVAILQAKGLRSNKWLNVRLGKEVKSGEVVAAFGNPSLEDGSLAKNAVTSGTVAVPKHDSWGSPRIVADLTIASGSSGGPLISMKDGSIVGVVVAVSSPEFGNPISGRSASGMYALIAPATEFEDWIGLTK